MRTHISTSVSNFQEWEAAAKLYMKVAPRIEAQLGSCHGLSLSDLFAMKALANDPTGHMRIQALAEGIGLSHSAMSRLVSRLEKVGSMRRFVCETDRRGIYIELTEQGRSELQRAETTYQQAVLQAMKHHRETPLPGMLMPE